MVSTLIILFASGFCLLLVWVILHSGLPPIRTLGDWEPNKHEVDIDAFRLLLESAEEQYLRRSLPPLAFRDFQRRRMQLALRSLDSVGHNALLLMKLGQMPQAGAD